MNYTIHLKKSSYETIEKTNIFSFLEEENSFSRFSQGVHATLNYYKEKTPKSTLVSEETKPVLHYTFSEDELCITTLESDLAVTINNLLFKGKNILHLPKTESAYDVERTWKIIQKKRDLSKIKKIYFVMEEWSKIVYAYRFVASYGIEVEDITYTK